MLEANLTKTCSRKLKRGIKKQYRTSNKLLKLHQCLTHMKPQISEVVTVFCP